jgi:transcriptional regulator of arginine metabolism
MQKTKRLVAIEKLIEEENITSQGVLLKKLKGKGMVCTQATLSRNLRQLGASRSPDGKGGYRYFLRGTGNLPGDETVNMNILPVVRDIVEAKGLMVMRTIPGNANATAYYIDNTERYEIAGTIAGDDTILIIPRKGITLGQVHTCLEIIIPGIHKHIAGFTGNKPERRIRQERIR